jgi:2-haloacid dehalogenase
MRALPAHPEVPGAIRRLRKEGFRTCALTNSTGAVAEAQLAHAGLDDLLDPVLSVDAVGRFKPAPEAYRMASERLGVEPAALRLVAAHDWDAIGAIRAGWAAAFVARPGQTWAPLTEPPDVVGRDLDEVVDRILELDG